MSAQQLAEACGKLGMEIPRAVLANLENGRRATVSAAELLVLAEALSVPPLLLLFPLGHADEVEALPNRRDAPHVAAKRFIGENGSDAPGVYDLFQNHEHYSRRFMESYRATVKAQTVDIKEASRLYELTRQDARPLRQTRQTMRAQGLTPPPLPDGLPDYFGFDTDEVA
jgi:transcriptional regulator with XRE-family HTH domain